MTQLYSGASRSARLTPCDSQPDAIGARLAAIGVYYKRLALPDVVFDGEAERDEIVGSYLDALNDLLADMPCASLDVLSVLPDHPRLAALQREFMTEHAHGTPEAQLLVFGQGVLYMRVATRVFALRCEAGDFVRLPPGLCHWFEMNCVTGFRTIRVFQDRAEPQNSQRGRDMRGAYRPDTGDRQSRSE